MPGGNASHKGSSAKPNTNAAGQIDTAADAVKPQDVLPEELTADIERTQEFVDYPPATQRPSDSKTEEQGK